MNGHPLGAEPGRPAPTPNPPAAACPLPPESQGPMNGVTLQRKVTVTNPEGFHLRPLAAFAETAMRFQSRVTVTKEGAGVDGKSPVALMGLAALPGTQLLLEVSGPDAPAALAALMEMLTSWPVAEEVREQGSGVRGQGSEVRGQRSEVGDPNAATRPPDPGLLAPDP